MNKKKTIIEQEAENKGRTRLVEQETENKGRTRLVEQEAENKEEQDQQNTK